MNRPTLAPPRRGNVIASKVALCVALAALIALAPLMRGAVSGEADVAAILEMSKVSGGLVVYLGPNNPCLLAALRPSPRFMVHGLATGEVDPAQARKALRELGDYGSVTLDRQEGELLPFIDNMVNLFIAEGLSGVSQDEVQRVLCPDGVALIREDGKWTRSVKPRPSEIDEWTHYFYDAKGNAVSHDTVVAPPERLQWLGSPRWSRHHDRMSSLSAMVSSGGRTFYIMDEGSRVSILLPSHWSLIARDAFNGVVLWKKPIDRWHNQLWPLKSGPTQLTRRLVAIKDSVYVTLSINAPVSCLDAATGDLVRVYESTKGAEEILVVGDVVYALINPELWVLTDFVPRYNTGDQKRVETEFNWDAKPRELQAVDRASGKVLWRKQGKIAPLTVAVDDRRLVYYDGDRLVCVNPADGETRWQSEPAAKRKLFEYNYAPRLLLHEDMVLYAGGDRAMKGYHADTGKEVWSAPHNKSGYRSPEDLIVTGGLVWNAPTISGNMSGAFTGRDPKTGEVKKEFPPDVKTYWFHHRCYIAKATDRFLIPSRTGIEFVDFNKEHWDLNHWVRSSCLYGVLPCNGLLYAGPHNCACYPETKLFGFNALAPGSSSGHPGPRPEKARLERGPAFQQPVDEIPAEEKDWPTYRQNAARSGHTAQPLAEQLAEQWNVQLGGRLSALIVAAGKLFVSQIDHHTVHALDAASGKPLWNVTVGGRVDSPPTYWNGRVVFGCADGWVYCLRASDGALIWRFQAALGDRRLMAHEQLESVWPVHGSVLVENGVASLVAGRSVFLDGGMRFFRLEVATGQKLVETVLDDRDPETGRDLHERVQTLQMPVGLNDILSSDGKFTYLRSQKFDAKGNRIDIGPVSGNAAVQGGTQQGEGAHIFAPMGFLDDSWFHRSYWVYGKNFAGGHNGYYQAGKYAPAGQILVFDEQNVYGYGREAKYLKWTTTLENQLFSASRKIPDVSPGSAPGGNAAGAAALPAVRFTDTPAINPADTPLTVEAWVMPDGPDGVVLSHGGNAQGYALALNGRKPAFYIRSNSELSSAKAETPIGEGWHHVAGVLEPDKTMRLYVDGSLVANGTAPNLVARKPAQGLELGADSGSQVGDYGPNHGYTGLIDQFAIFHRALSAEEVALHASPLFSPRIADGAVLFSSFDRGDARDESGGQSHGVLSGVDTGKGRSGAALWFRKPATAPLFAPARPGNPAGASQPSNTFVEHHWQRFVPLFARAMAMAGKTILISGPADIVNEETAFERLVAKDPAVQAELAEQDAILNGERGAKLLAVSMKDGKLLHEIALKAPPVWDGMAIAQSRVYLATLDGRVLCFGGPAVAAVDDRKFWFSTARSF
ncbi:MAG: PQQ-binding-like beta-propeller repeat protein [Verrucomicrobia bacterium]|nr:PQQ-binding-like beta-propeller repeat protein [Verrucomicrobiota bacterium]